MLMKERDRLKVLRSSNFSFMDELEEANKGKGKDKQTIRKKHTRATWYERKLGQAGINLPARLYVAGAIMVSIAAGLLSLVLGIVLSIFVVITVSQYLLLSYLEDRATKRQKKVIPQLAPFIDGLASALSTGFNTEAAIVQAMEGVPPGLLRTELERVARALATGFTVREAMNILKERIAGKEVTSLAVALSLFASMGGSVLEPFRRLAKKIREQQVVAEKANRDLVMVKQAFYIIFFLAISAPGILLVIQPEYLGQAFTDSLGRFILQLGAIMVLTALIVFRKITNIKV